MTTEPQSLLPQEECAVQLHLLHTAEDDTAAKLHYRCTMKNLAIQQPAEDWMILAFSQLGSIEKMFKWLNLGLNMEFIFILPGQAHQMAPGPYPRRARSTGTHRRQACGSTSSPPLPGSGHSHLSGWQAISRNLRIRTLPGAALKESELARRGDHKPVDVEHLPLDMAHLRRAASRPSGTRPGRPSASASARSCVCSTSVEVLPFANRQSSQELLQEGRSHTF